MSNNIIENQSVTERRVAYSPLSQELDNPISSSQANHIKDELARADRKTIKLAQKEPYTRPELPAPKHHLPRSELAMLTKAFIEAFSAMDKGTIEQAKNYTELQELDQMQAKQVLDSSTHAIAKEMHQMKISAALTKQMKEQANIQEAFSWVTMGLSVLLVVATFAVGFLSGGAADVAIPEEIEMVGMEGSEMAETGGDEASNIGNSVEDGSDEDGVNMGENEPSINSENLNANEDPSAQIDNELSASDNSNINSADKFNRAFEQTEENVSNASKGGDSFENDSKVAARKLGQNTEETSPARTRWDRYGKKMFHFGMGAVVGSPMLAEGIASLNVVSKLKAVATAQQDTGVALDMLQQNNMVFNFMQQLVQRSGTVVEQEVSGGSDIVNTYASITHAYSDIASGLSNAV